MDIILSQYKSTVILARRKPLGERFSHGLQYDELLSLNTVCSPGLLIERIVL
jgi:hypothetical protein